MGDTSVSQGSVISGTLYIIMTLDMANQSHPIRHQNQKEQKICSNPDANVYVDDVFGILEGTKNNIWKKLTFS